MLPIRMVAPALVAVACQAGDEPGAAASPEQATVPWSGSLPAAAVDVGTVRDFTVQRAIVHLHSPLSHDACDGDPMPGGEPDLDCLQDLRDGLCTVSADYAFLSDHPSTFAEQPWETVFLQQAGDEILDGDGRPTTDAGTARAMRLTCPDGHMVTWLPGVEDELMPLGLDRHAGEDAAENDAIYNAIDEAAVQADSAAGAIVMVAHTEGRTAESLAPLVPAGLAGVEIFNLHAMFDPDNRTEDLGLDAMGWLADIAPFTAEDGTAEPDLLYLAVHMEQAPSVATWDALQAEGRVVGVAGTDAHQNVLPMTLRDGERADSYRRMMRWFGNYLLVRDDASGPEAADEALAAGRLYVAFDALGTPAGVDLHLLAQDGSTWEPGETAPPGALHVPCPALSPASPRGKDAPEISALVFRDGEIWREGCGDHDTDGAGSYRVRYDIVPWHLADFLGDDPDPWLHSYPWIYTNPIHVTEAR